MKTKQIKRPIDARGFNQVCTLKTDNHSTRDFWIMLDYPDVVICKQRNGYDATAEISIPKSQFDNLIKWYLAKQ